MEEENDVIDVDRMREAVTVTFRNGTTVLFRSQFLWDAREQHGNRILVVDGEHLDVF